MQHVNETHTFEWKTQMLNYYNFAGARPVCAQDSVHDSIANFIIDGLLIGTADEELVLRAEDKADGGSAWGPGWEGKGDSYLAQNGLSYCCIQTFIHFFVCSYNNSSRSRGHVFLPYFVL